MKLLKLAGLGISLLFVFSAAVPIALAEECHIERDGPFGLWTTEGCYTTDGYESPHQIEFVSRPTPPELPNLVPIDASITLFEEDKNWITLKLKLKNTGSAPSGDYNWHIVVYVSDGYTMWPAHTFTGNETSLAAGEVTEPRIQTTANTGTEFLKDLRLEVVWTVDATDYNRGGEIREQNENDNVWKDASGTFPSCIIYLDSDGERDCDV